MVTINLSGIMKGGRAFYLAYDQGMEHGPEEFDNSNVDPLSIIKLAKEGRYNGLILQKGLADKYKKEIAESGVPLILKLNGKTNLYQGEPVSRMLCTVSEAMKLGARAVGYTIYIGSRHESIMLEEFEKILREAHKNKIPVIAWIYPRGKSLKDKSPRDIMAYAARVGLEIDADIVKLKYDGKIDDLKWALKSAGRAKIVVAGGEKVSEDIFIKNIRDSIGAGVSGVAVGRNIWKSKNPLKLSEKARGIVFAHE